MKKIFTIFIFVFLLVGCEKPVTETIIEKKDFYIETKNINEFAKDLAFKKTGKVSSSQDIKMTSQISGRVNSIYVKQGDFVNKGAVIGVLDDNIANYSLNLERAKNTLDQAKINYETTESQLNKNISDLEINLANLKIDKTNSSSSLELEKIDNSLKKLAIDYENLKISNIQQINGFKNSLNKDLVSFIIFTDDVIDFTDRLLGVTSENKDKDDDFESFLGVKDSAQKNKTKKLLRDLIQYRENDLLNVNYDFDGVELFNENEEKIESGYMLIKELLNNTEKVLDNSILSIGNLSSLQINTYKGNISSFWITYNGNNAGFVALKNSIDTFLDTYKNSEESLLKQIELLYSDKKIYIKGLDIKLEIDEGTLEEAKKNKELTLKRLDTVIIDAQISYKQALSNYNKLAIRAPISGTVGDVFIDVGQEVGPGTPLFNLSNNSSNEVVISFSKNELDMVGIGNIANVFFDGESYTGSIYSISNVADENLKYISRVIFTEGVNFIGDIVNVSIPFETDKSLLPINIIKIDDNGKGVINVLIDGVIHKRPLSIGNIYSDKVEITEKINPDLDIIITNTDNFDKNKFNLKLKEKLGQN